MVRTRVFEIAHYPKRQATLEEYVEYCTAGNRDNHTAREVRWEVKAWKASHEYRPDPAVSGDSWQRALLKVYCPKPTATTLGLDAHQHGFAGLPTDSSGG
jgi:hypothetical protein